MYFCSKCRKQVDSIQDLFFVQDNSQNGFCSDECIEKYYLSNVEYFEKKELDLRTELKIFDINIVERANHQTLIDQTLKIPSRVFILQNDLGDKYYQLVKYFDQESLIVLINCFILDKQPSFVFNVVTTDNKVLVDALKFKNEVKENVLSYQNISEHSSFSTEDINQKKSEYLAKLIENRLDNDIDFEQFNHYDEFFDVTINEPDEILHHVDDMSDNIFIFIKALIKDDKSFFYFVICCGGENIQSDELVTIISFPTISEQLYKLFRLGKVISGKTVN